MPTPQPTLSNLFPTLKPGLNILELPEKTPGALHRLVIAELINRDGHTYWIDARNNASTYSLTDLAPHPRALANLRIARAFTAYQHHAITRSLPKHVSPQTALVVAPLITDLYRDDDIPEPEDRTYLEATITILKELATSISIPVLASTINHDTLTDTIAPYTTQHITCTPTPLGFHYATPDFQTRIYLAPTHWQTTIPYWVDLAGTCEPALASSTPEPITADAPA